MAYHNIYLKNIPYVLGENVQSASVGWNSMYMSVRPGLVYSVVQI